MFSKAATESLMARIREGGKLRQSEKLNLIIQLSIPSMLAQISNVLMFFIDAAMVGSLGAEASASIGLVESAGWLFGALTSAAAVGVAVQTAHFIGANDFKNARRVMRHGYIFCILFSLVLMAAAVGIAPYLPVWLHGEPGIRHDATVYFLIFGLAAPFFTLENLSSSMLKASGDMRHPSAIAIVMCVLDVAFNFLFIFPTRPLQVLGLTFTMPGMGLGVAGAALGTCLAFIVTAALLIYYAVFKSSILAWKLDDEPFRWDNTFILKAMKISAPMALQYALMNGAQIVSTRIVAPLGNIAIAAHSFAITAESLCYMPGYGIGDAASTLVGQTYGAGRFRLCRSFAHLTVGMGMIVMAVMGLVMYVFAPEMIAVLSPVEQIRTLGAEVLRIEAFAEPFFAASIVTYSAFVGAGDTLWPSVFNLGSMWFVRLTLAALLAPHYGLRGVWVAMATELTFRGVLFLLRLWKGRWLKYDEATAQTRA